jgi:hypothetical protein
LLLVDKRVPATLVLLVLLVRKDAMFVPSMGDIEFEEVKILNLYYANDYSTSAFRFRIFTS